MVDTKELLRQISTLRQRLAQTRQSTGAPTANLPLSAGPTADPVQAFQCHVEAGWHDVLALKEATQQLPHAMPVQETESLPSLLTSRGVRLLKHGKELLHEMRALAEDTALFPEDEADEQEPLGLLHRDMVAVTEVVVRAIQALPPTASVQTRLCEGIEGILAMVDEKLSILKSGLSLRRKEQRWIDSLAEILTNILHGGASGLASLKQLAAEILTEARQGQALRFLYAAPSEPARFIAAHSLNLAQVLGRVLHTRGEGLGARDEERPDLVSPLAPNPSPLVWQAQPDEPLLTAFLHDIGMLLVPSELLSLDGPLSDEQRRIVERHVGVGAEVAARLWLEDSGYPQVRAIAEHHERVDGTGYPAGRREQQLSSFSRFFAACDVYAALNAPRPYRLAVDSGAAIREVLLLADQGILDRAQVELLLTLSYHPVGSVVELSDGSIATVVAVHPGTAHPAQPVVTLLADAHGFPPPIPRQIDLAEDMQCSIARNMPVQERRPFLRKRYPELA